MWPFDRIPDCLLDQILVDFSNSGRLTLPPSNQETFWLARSDFQLATRRRTSQFPLRPTTVPFDGNYGSQLRARLRQVSATFQSIQAIDKVDQARAVITTVIVMDQRYRGFT